jgi:hypothetical protein
MTSASVIASLRNFFANHGPPVILHPDNRPQLVSEATTRFLQDWGVILEPSFPYLHRTNAHAEAAVKAMKRIIRGTTPPDTTRPDPDALTKGILAFCNTARYGGRSPAQAIRGHNVREDLPVHELADDPRWAPNLLKLNWQAEHTRASLQSRYDARARPLEPYPAGTHIAVQNTATGRWDTTGTVQKVLDHHDYQLLKDHGGIWRRN